MVKHQNITQNIISPNNYLEVFKRPFFSHCFQKNGDFDFEKFKRGLQSNKINFSKESYEEV